VTEDREDSICLSLSKNVVKADRDDILDCIGFMN